MILKSSPLILSTLAAANLSIGGSGGNECFETARVGEFRDTVEAGWAEGEVALGMLCAGVIGRDVGVYENVGDTTRDGREVTTES